MCAVVFVREMRPVPYRQFTLGWWSTSMHHTIHVLRGRITRLQKNPSRLSIMLLLLRLPNSFRLHHFGFVKEERLMATFELSCRSYIG